VTSKTPIEHIQIRVFAHATEDPEKVLTAVRNTLPKELNANTAFQKTSLTGHHGNPITLFETKLTDKQALPTALEKIANALNALDKENLNSEIKLHLEKRNLYLRFNKQSAYMGELRLSPNDPIHFKIHFKNKTPEEIMEICRKTGLLP
jgi:RNA binding exosome subunit